LIATGQQNHARPLQASERLTQQAAGKKPPMPPGIGGIDQHEIKVPLQAAMLKAIIQNQQLALQLLHRGSGQGDAVRALEMRHTG
jgi:hypothetical protein